MKKVAWYGLITVLILLLTGCTQESVQIYSVDTPYVYPIQYGSEDWTSLKESNWAESGEKTTLEWKLKIPAELMEKMSTSALVDTVLSYPLIGQYAIYGKLRDGYNRVRVMCNGIDELSNRKDAAKVLLQNYLQAEVLTPEEMLLYEKGWDESNNYRHLHSYLNDIEFLLSQDVFNSQLSNNELHIFEQKVSENYKLKMSYGNIYNRNNSSVYYLGLHQIQNGSLEIQVGDIIFMSNGEKIVL